MRRFLPSEIINCPDCNLEISTTAKNCVHCGSKMNYAKVYKQASENWRIKYWMLFGFIMVVTITAMVLSYLKNNYII